MWGVFNNGCGHLKWVWFSKSLPGLPDPVLLYLAYMATDIINWEPEGVVIIQGDMYTQRIVSLFHL